MKTMWLRMALRCHGAPPTLHRDEQADEPKPCRPGSRRAARRCKGAAPAAASTAASVSGAAAAAFVADTVHAHTAWARAAIGLLRVRAPGGRIACPRLVAFVARRAHNRRSAHAHAFLARIH